MLIVDYKTNLTENDEKSWKISILSNFNPLGAVKDINIFEKPFDFFKAHIKRQLLVALPYQGSKFIFLPWRSLHPTVRSRTIRPWTIRPRTIRPFIVRKIMYKKNLATNYFINPVPI